VVEVLSESRSFALISDLDPLRSKYERSSMGGGRGPEATDIMDPSRKACSRL